jgi:cellulase/cellobiase CelA1
VEGNRRAWHRECADGLSQVVQGREFGKDAGEAGLKVSSAGADQPIARAFPFAESFLRDSGPGRDAALEKFAITGTYTTAASHGGAGEARGKQLIWCQRRDRAVALHAHGVFSKNYWAVS